ncbi:30847_t:CDS:2 [Gigaspora margarita]|uniref:30847_t:CDS:1 n=1 Tax=Gigaspora margarita TaxID=4874 RepID=A0ABN7UZW1_GIGMA|nr:30847_t:CDS:2 [Gigaspora margarita]
MSEEAQDTDGKRDKDTEKVKQEDKLEPKHSKVHFTIWDLPNRILIKQVSEMVKKFSQPRMVS